MLAYLIMAGVGITTRYIIIEVESNKHKAILHEIYSLRLPSLRVLDLSTNKIESIEYIHRLEIPLVKELYFCSYGLMQIETIYYQLRG